MKPVLIALTASGAVLARHLAVPLGATLHGLRGRVADADRHFDDATVEIRRLHEAGHAVIGLCAAGILIRAVAPAVDDKRRDAALVAVAQDGSVAVPLLGGHHGANDLARRIAALTGGVAAITTAGDVAFGIALDMPPPGWRIADAAAVKPATAALLAGDKATLVIDHEISDAAGWLNALPQAESGGRTIAVTARVPPAGDALVYHPPVLALGAGGERGVAADEMIALAERALAAQGLSPRAVACIASIDLKEDEPAMHALGAHFDVPVRFFDATTLAAETPRLANPSDVVMRATGCPGVAEGAALAAAGPHSALIVPKQKSARGTCAIALSPGVIDPLAVGHARGTLAIVGIGPGDPGWRTPEATEALERADEVVGYTLYLDLVADAIAGKRRHDGTLGAEEERVRLALDRAAAGRNVALVSSGDAGIYGLATLAFELIDRGGRDDWRRVAVQVCPGISALQAAAARTGAPLGHDFCAISLSDLLTPWPTIERRLEAAAAADFVIALYNPASQRRVTQFRRAIAIVGATRPPDTPVAIARNLGRPGETLAITTLADAAAAEIDMLTIVVVGSSQTRRALAGGTPRLYTPRGYAAGRVPR